MGAPNYSLMVFIKLCCQPSFPLHNSFVPVDSLFTLSKKFIALNVLQNILMVTRDGLGCGKYDWLERQIHKGSICSCKPLFSATAPSPVPQIRSRSLALAAILPKCMNGPVILIVQAGVLLKRIPLLVLIL